MKKITATLLSVIILFSLLIPVQAAKTDFSADFSGMELPPGWYTNGNYSDVIKIEPDSQKGGVKFQASAGDVSKYVYWSTFGLKLNKEIANNSSLDISIDFMIEDIGAVKTDRLFDVCLKPLSQDGINKGLKENWVPHITGDGTFQGSSEKAEAGVWYTQKNSLNTVTGAISAVWTKKGSSEVIAEYTSNPGYKNTGGIQSINIIPLSDGVFYIRSINIGSKMSLSINSPKDGEEVDISKPLIINGTIPYDVSLAEVYIDDVCVLTIDNSGESDMFTENINISEYNEGAHVIKVSCGGETVEKTVIFKLPDIERGVTYPAKDSIVAKNDFKYVEVSAFEGETVYLFLDGDFIKKFKSTGLDKIEIEKNLSIGKHKAETVIGQKKYITEFMVNDVLNTNLMTCDFTGGDYYPFGASKFTVGYDENGNGVTVDPAAFTGIDGDENGAFGFITSEPWEDDTGIWKNKTGATMHLGMQNYGISGGMVMFQYDIKLFDYCTFGIEAYSPGASSNWLYIGDPVFSSQGKIAKSADSYNKNEWMHVKQIVNFKNKTETLYVNDKCYLNETPIRDDANTIERINVYASITRKEAGQGYALDNFEVTKNIFYTEFENLSYSETADGLFKEATKNTVPKNAKRIKLTCSNTFIEPGIITDFVKLSADGYDIKLEKAELTKNGELTITAKSVLPDGAKCILSVTNKNNDKIYENEFKVADSGIYAESTFFQNDGKTVFAEQQINKEKSISAGAVIKNDSDDTKNGVIMCSAFDGNEIKFVSAKSVSLSAGESENVSFEIPGGVTNVKIYVIDSFSSGKPLTGVYSLIKG